MAVERQRRFIARQRGAGGNLGDEPLEVVRALPPVPHILVLLLAPALWGHARRSTARASSRKFFSIGGAVLGGDAFRVELHAVHRPRFVREPHDEPVVGLPRHC